MTSTLRVNAANTARTKPTTGDTKMSFVNVDHLGWLICKNNDNPDLPRALDTTAYNLLFQVIGYTFGGSGNTFHLPHVTGRVMGTVGKVIDTNGRPATYVASTNNGKVGEIDHKLTVPEMPAHNHNEATDSPGVNTVLDGTTSSNVHDHGGSTGSASSSTGSVEVITVPEFGTNVATSSGTHSHTISSVTHSHTISSNGGNEYHNNMQPTLFYGNTFIYCGIPMMGEFPFKTGLAPVLI
jgi:microcystin-dependent protein